MAKRTSKLQLDAIIKGKAPKRYPLGDGLYFTIKKSGAMSFGIRYQIDGEPDYKGLGAYDKVNNNLGIARAKCEAYRVQIKQGINPKIEEQKDYIEFGVDVVQLYKTKGSDKKYNVILKGGDVVEVPKVDNTVEIIGEVEQPTVINYRKGLSAMEAIGQAGGLTDLAKKRGVFVIYQNGNISSNKQYFLFNSMPKLEPGSKIIVPKKIANPNKTNIAEIIGLTSTLATLAVLINSL